MIAVIAMLIGYSLYVNLKIARTGEEPGHKDRINAIYDGSRVEKGGFHRLNY